MRAPPDIRELAVDGVINSSRPMVGLSVRRVLTPLVAGAVSVLEVAAFALAHSFASPAG